MPIRIHRSRQFGGPTELYAGDAAVATEGPPETDTGAVPGGNPYADGYSASY